MYDLEIVVSNTTRVSCIFGIIPGKPEIIFIGVDPKNKIDIEIQFSTVANKSAPIKQQTTAQQQLR